MVVTPFLVRDYVVSKFRAVLCDPTIATEIAAKATEIARAETTTNVESFRTQVKKLLEPYTDFMDVSALSCAR
jgi:hypothetical protein